MEGTNPSFLESYKHIAAKHVLARWLSSDYTVKPEQYFGHDTLVFKPDLTTYTGGKVAVFWEVTHTNDVDGYKLMKMQYYCYVTGQEILCYEVDAEWILRQTCKPKKIEKFTYTLIK